MSGVPPLRGDARLYESKARPAYLEALVMRLPISLAAMRCASANNRATRNAARAEYDRSAALV